MTIVHRASERKRFLQESVIGRIMGLQVIQILGIGTHWKPTVVPPARGILKMSLLRSETAFFPFIAGWKGAGHGHARSFSSGKIIFWVSLSSQESALFSDQTRCEWSSFVFQLKIRFAQSFFSLNAELARLQLRVESVRNSQELHWVRKYRRLETRSGPSEYVSRFRISFHWGMLFERILGLANANPDSIWSHCHLV